MSINKVILVGNVGKDPVIRYFDKGVAKVTFPMATSETYTNQQGETVTQTEWHNIVLWRALAEVAEKTVKKGSQVYIVGKIKTRSYADKDGVNKYITEILADTLLVLEKKQGQSSYTGQAETGRNETRETNGNPHVINEPGQSYTAADSPAGSSGTVIPKRDENGPEEDFRNGQAKDQNEDDLPF